MSYKKYVNYGWSFYPSISYSLRTNTIQNTFISNDIYFYNTSVNVDTPPKTLSFNFRTVYNYKYWRVTFNTDYRNSNYATLLNQQEQKVANNNYSGN